VPINIHSDGAFRVTVRADPKSMPLLSAEEERRVVVASDTYRLATSGRIGVSGIEYVGRVDDRVTEGRLEPGAYGAIVHLMGLTRITLGGLAPLTANRDGKWRLSHHETLRFAQRLGCRAGGARRHPQSRA